MASLKISTAKAHQAQAGFTLIELLVVLGMLAMVGSLALVVSMTSYRGYSFRNERDSLISSLERARSEAVSNMCFSSAGAPCINGKPHGLHIMSGQYVVFQGTSWASRDSAVDEQVPIQSKAIMFSGVSDVVFDELVGTAVTIPAAPMKITLTDPTGKDVSVVSLTPEGRICVDDPAC